MIPVKAITLFFLLGSLAAGLKMLFEILLHSRPRGARKTAGEDSSRKEHWTSKEIAEEGLGYAERSDISYRHYNAHIRRNT